MKPMTKKLNIALLFLISLALIILLACEELPPEEEMTAIPTLEIPQLGVTLNDFIFIDGLQYEMDRPLINEILINKTVKRDGDKYYILYSLKNTGSEKKEVSMLWRIDLSSDYGKAFVEQLMSLDNDFTATLQEPFVAEFFKLDSDEGEPRDRQAFFTKFDVVNEVFGSVSSVYSSENRYLYVSSGTIDLRPGQEATEFNSTLGVGCNNLNPFYDFINVSSDGQCGAVAICDSCYYCRADALDSVCPEDFADYNGVRANCSGCPDADCAHCDNGDASQDCCENPIFGFWGAWLYGGEYQGFGEYELGYEQECCADDSGEYSQIFRWACGNAIDQPQQPHEGEYCEDAGDNVCCSSESDCVYDGYCYPSVSLACGDFSSYYEEHADFAYFTDFVDQLYNDGRISKQEKDELFGYILRIQGHIGDYDMKGIKDETSDLSDYIASLELEESFKAVLQDFVFNLQITTRNFRPSCMHIQDDSSDVEICNMESPSMWYDPDSSESYCNLAGPISGSGTQWMAADYSCESYKDGRWGDRDDTDCNDVDGGEEFEGDYCCGDDSFENYQDCTNTDCSGKGFDGYVGTSAGCCDSPTDCAWEDGDGHIVCYDGDESGYCEDGIDNDCDGYVDMCDSDCGGECTYINGTVTNTTEPPAPLEGALIEIIGVSQDDGQTYTYTATTDEEGYYKVSVQGNTVYDIIASKTGYIYSARYGVLVPNLVPKTVDFQLEKYNGLCEPDCTYADDNICHPECDGINGCGFYDEISKEACDGKMPQMIVDYSETYLVSCCEGAPYEDLTKSGRIKINADDSVCKQRTVLYGGDPVTMYICILS